MNPTSSHAPTGGIEWASVDLGPSLPMAVFTSMERWHPERIGALALYCSDGRWGEAFDDFCHRRLLIPRYDRWAVPGGPGILLPRDNNRDFLHATREQLDFLVRVHELERIVLITHYGCAYYAGLLNRDADGCLAVQMEETLKAGETLRRWFPCIGVESYLAMRRHNCLSFHELRG
jgi:hypothetical protein